MENYPLKVVGLIFLTVLSLAIFTTNCSATGVSHEIRELYARFYMAQNDRNLDKVAMEIADVPDFLWVSDGKSIWGRQTAIDRMKTFQQAEVWRVEPNLPAAKVVEISDKSAYLHLPLDLVIGAATAPDRLHFLVEVLCVKTMEGWKISALFTTTAKPE